MAMVLDMFVQKTLGKLAEIGEKEACKVLGVKDEIKRLESTLRGISRFLEEAERMRHTDVAIDNWVEELKDIMYDADDIIDLCMFGDGKLLELQQDPSSSPICFPLSSPSSCFSCVKYRYEIANRTQKLNGKLLDLAYHNQVIPKLEKSSNQGSQGSVVSSREPSHMQVDSDIVGTQIEDAANDIIKWILGEADERQCKVYGIVGMGGIGKTTLACKIFNDQKIKDNFSTRIWLFVSKNYSETELFKELIRETGGNVGGARSIAELEQKFFSNLHSNDTKILLVLDDLWSADVWNNRFSIPILCSNVSIKILITSRDVRVGRAMGATIDHIHHVEKIDKEDGWELLRKIVFKDGDEGMLPIFKNIGTKIVDKCDGLPFAIKEMAHNLSERDRTPGEWEKVLHSDLWQMNKIEDKIPRVLYLSYEDLLPELKPCFLSCALFRGCKEYSYLINLWMAEGFIVDKENELMEESGENHFETLVSKNLLQLDPSYSDDNYFLMHDLLGAFATNLMKEGIMLAEDKTLKSNSSMKIRRLSMSNKGETLTLPSLIIEQNCLRVLLVHSSPETKELKDNTLKTLRYLRILDLSNTSIESIPDSIGKLLHLRCLNLSGTKICELPESIVNLMNLQTLSIRYCRSLYQLSNNIIRLCNLRCLCLDGTPLTHVPKGIGKLENINHLDGFVVGHDDSANAEGCDLEELQCFSSLRILKLHRLERARASINEGRKVLADRTPLKQLFMLWSEESARDNSHGAASTGDEEIIKRAESVCSQLFPPSSLKILGIGNFPGRQFPVWIMSTSLDAFFPQLAYIKIINFPLCTVLPPLGQLPQLKYVEIKRALRIKKIGPEFLGGHGFSKLHAFPKLHYLQFEDMPNWEKWELCPEREEEEKVGDKRNHLKLFPNLTKCLLIGCSRLTALPEAIYHATHLKVLEVRHCERLKRISNLPSLKCLIIDDCSSLEHVENVDTLQSLHLICHLTNNEFLPQWLLDLLTRYNHRCQRYPKEFRMRCSLLLLKSCLKGKPYWHIIQQIPKVYIETIDDEHSMQYTMDPLYYDTTVK